MPEELGYDSVEIPFKYQESMECLYLEGAPKRTRRCCCCLHTRKSKYICAGITFLLLTGLGIASYFCYPRGMPEVKYESMSIPRLINRKAQFGEQWSQSPAMLNMETNIDFRTYNPNLIPIKMNNISLSVYYTSSDLKLKISQGELAQAVTFAPRESTKFTLPLILSFDTSDSRSLALVRDMLDRCGITSRWKQQIALSYEAILDISLLSWTGFKPLISNNMLLDCPLNRDSLLSLLR
ncbi:hypothetical protein K7432_013128 [Basidiobolus ranarum]|uniref:Late embryogenesis abundant protein LEA-2 subgroup domain-containing protein n=1 Tax=Basidiobolus ranarum TaxID=34480 RepID=A0ABR2WJQ7_9FUNG